MFKIFKITILIFTLAFLFIYIIGFDRVEAACTYNLGSPITSSDTSNIENRIFPGPIGSDYDYWIIDKFFGTGCGGWATITATLPANISQKYYAMVPIAWTSRANVARYFTNDEGRDYLNNVHFYGGGNAGGELNAFNRPGSYEFPINCSQCQNYLDKGWICCPYGSRTTLTPVYDDDLRCNIKLRTCTSWTQECAHNTAFTGGFCLSYNNVCSNWQIN